MNENKKSDKTKQRPIYTLITKSKFFKVLYFILIQYSKKLKYSVKTSFQKDVVNTRLIKNNRNLFFNLNGWIPDDIS